MNDGPINPADMVETTDSLEAVGVFRGWKNLCFTILLICLLLTQIAFWLVNLGIIKTAPATSVPAVQAEPAATTPAAAASAQTDPNDAAAGRGFLAGVFDKLDFEYVVRTIGLINGVLLAAAMLFCLTMFSSLIISLTGRLGGINHISRAFILSLIVLVLTVPWQALNLSILGVIWTPNELLRWLAVRDDTLWNTVVYYLRFSIYWLAIVLLLLLAQVRSARWSKAILRRLEII